MVEKTVNTVPTCRLVTVWLGFAVLLIGIVLHETTGIFQAAFQASTGRIQMFQFDEADLSRVEITYQSRTAALIRNAAGLWLDNGEEHIHLNEITTLQHSRRQVSELHGHRSDANRSTRIREKLALMSRMRADRRVKPEWGLEHYGLQRPQAQLTFYGLGATVQPLARLEVGDLLPTTFAYYTRLEGDRELLLVPRYYIALILALAFGEDVAPTPLPSREKSLEGSDLNFK